MMSKWTLEACGICFWSGGAVAKALAAARDPGRSCALLDAGFIDTVRDALVCGNGKISLRCSVDDTAII